MLDTSLLNFIESYYQLQALELKITTIKHLTDSCLKIPRHVKLVPF